MPPSTPVLSQLLSRSYATLDVAEREDWVQSILREIDSGGRSAPAAPPHAGGTTRRSKLRRQAPTAPPDLNAPITSLRGVNASLTSKFARIGVSTVLDLIYLFPNRHADYSCMRPIAELVPGAEQTAVATVWEAGERVMPGRKRAAEAIVGDESGNIRVIWFNQPYLAKTLKPNSRIVISGKVGLYRGRKVFESPEWEFLDSDDLTHTGRLVPIYPLTAGLSPRVVRRLIKGVLDSCLPALPDFLPEEVLERAGLLSLPEAIGQAHYPDSEWSKNQARKRLAFDELFLIQLGVLSKRRDWRQEENGYVLRADDDAIEPFLSSLPFALTDAQRRALRETQGDLTSSRPMSRLLQGDVGSGKTVIATAAMLIAVASGCQAALMAPTEILAEQHFGTLCRLFQGEQDTYANGSVKTFQLAPSRLVTVALLHGGLRNSVKRDVQDRISANEVDIVIGTHALLQKGVEFRRLGFCVVDEQHRFGVMQRSELRSKGASPHILVMSATPIPRSLALTMYGDLDISVIDEMPPGRTEIKTKWLTPNQRQSAYDFVAKQIATGRQAFIICPLIEESEAIQTKAAVAEYERLCSSVFPGLRLGLLHGRMSSSDKEGVMEQFRCGDLDILVSTPVVEVGVDVPNATVMLIEGADRFGLAQLHQFRGRVGRGEHQSFCILLADTPSPEARQRLSLLECTRDGFALAEEDLRLRGPGEFFGTRQSGLPELRMARLSDVQLLELARNEAIRLFDNDPYLKRPEHRLLSEEVGRLWRSGGEPS
jgi:ATP-dependent DNA helicase RecG